MPHRAKYGQGMRMVVQLECCQPLSASRSRPSSAGSQLEVFPIPENWPPEASCMQNTPWAHAKVAPKLPSKKPSGLPFSSTCSPQYGDELPAHPTLFPFAASSRLGAAVCVCWGWGAVYSCTGSHWNKTLFLPSRPIQPAQAFPLSLVSVLMVHSWLLWVVSYAGCRDPLSAGVPQTRGPLCISLLRQMDNLALSMLRLQITKECNFKNGRLNKTQVLLCIRDMHKGHFVVVAGSDLFRATLTKPF